MVGNKIGRKRHKVGRKRHKVGRKRHKVGGKENVISLWVRFHCATVTLKRCVGSCR